jgi:menaquinone-dependent protoporphyrinogen oxidase
MAKKVLVGYATRYNSTQEVADKIAQTLRLQGLDVELQAMRKVTSLDKYEAVVLGAPIFIGSLHKDVKGFMGRHKDALLQRPTAFFALGPLENVDKAKTPEAVQGVAEQLDKALEKYTWFKPVAKVLFGGKYDPATLRFPDTLIANLAASPLHGVPLSDARDWAAIEAWAVALAAQL